MADFITIQEDEQLTKADKNQLWISTLGAGEQIVMFFEWLAMSGAIFVMGMAIINRLGFGDFVNAVITVVGCLSVMLAVIFFISVQKIAFYGFLKALKTKTLKDDAFQLLISFLISGAFFWVSREGDRALFVDYFAHKAVINTDYKKDGRVKHIEEQKAKNELQKNNAIKEMVCTECTKASSKFDKEILDLQKKINKLKGNETWVINTKANLEAQISTLKKSKKTALEDANADFEIRKASKRAEFDNIDTIYTNQEVALTRGIDSTNNKEEIAETQSKAKMGWFAGILAIMTQVSLFFIRIFRHIFNLRADNVPSTVGAFMSDGILGMIFSPVVTWFQIRKDKSDIMRARQAGDAVIGVETFKNTNLTGDIHKELHSRGALTYAHAKKIASEKKQPVTSFGDGDNGESEGMSGEDVNLTSGDLSEKKEDILEEKISEKIPKKTVNNIENVENNELSLSKQNDEVSEFIGILEDMILSSKNADEIKEIEEFISILKSVFLNF